MTASTPDHTAILAAASFDPMPPLPSAVPGPPAMRSSSWSISTTSSMSEAPAGPAGIAGQQTGGVGQKHQQVGPHQMGDEGTEPVVVAEADLLVGHRIVLVDHRHHTEVEQAAERLAGVEVLAAVDEVERGQQDLPGDQPAPTRGRRTTPA